MHREGQGASDWSSIALVRVGFLEISGAIASSIRPDLLDALVRGLAGDIFSVVEFEFQRQVPCVRLLLPVKWLSMAGLGSVRPFSSTPSERTCPPVTPAA